MFRNIALTSSLLSLAAAAPQVYGGSPPEYSGHKSSPRVSPHHTPHHTPHGTPRHSAGYGSGSFKPVVTSVHHVTVTDHVTATDGGCDAGQSSAARPTGSYVASSGAAKALASTLPLPPYTPSAPPSSTVPAATLAPCTGPDHDGNNLTHLAPATSNNLYYAPPNTDTSLTHMFASLDLNYTKPAVVLENSAYVSKVTCSSDGIGITFNGDQGYNYAKQQWSSFGGQFILVSHTDGCKNTTTDQRTFWQVSDTSFDDNSKACDVKCSEIGITQAANEMHAEWGNFNKNGPSPSGATPSQTDSAAAQITAPPSDEDLDARGLWGDITSEWGKATSAVESVVSEVTSKAESVVSEVTSAAVSAADKSFATTFTVDINAKPTNTASGAPWPNAVEITSADGIDAYCVDCGATGQADISGSADISFLQAKIKSGQFAVNGNLAASMGVGLNAQGASFSPFSKTVQLVEIPLSPLEIPEILVIGPFINLDASFNIDIQAAGEIMVEVGASLPKFSATLDLLDKSKNSQSGFQPQWTHNFSAEGEVIVTATLGLPVQLGFGLDVRALPSLNANTSITNTASVSAYANYTNEPGPCQDGVGWGIHFNDNVDFNVLNVYDDQLFSWQSPDVASGCVGGKKSSSSTPGSTPTPTPGSSSSPATAKHSGKPYSPTYSTPAGTPKQSGKAYTPTYNSTPASGTPTGGLKHTGKPYSPISSAPSAPVSSDTSSPSTDSGSSSAAATDSAASSSSSSTRTKSRKHTPTPTPTPTYKRRSF